MKCVELVDCILRADAEDSSVWHRDAESERTLYDVKQWVVIRELAKSIDILAGPTYGPMLNEGEE